MPMKSFFGWGSKEEESQSEKKQVILPEEQREYLESDKSILGDQDGTHEQRLQKVAEREVQSAAEDSLKKIHIIQLGRCPVCGEHLSQHLAANICESCGWNKYDSPKSGKVRVHLTGSNEVIEGDHAYVLKTGGCLVIRGPVVYARIPANGFSWVEYGWSEEELEQREKQAREQMQVTCAWCGGEANVNKDGFHLIHVAFGTMQERYCFCCDECYEAFRKMYPSRVHRDCYDRNCNTCNLCVKRYSDEAEELRLREKISAKSQEKKQAAEKKQP